MKQTERTNNHGLFMQLLFALVMFLPIEAWGQAEIIYYPIIVGGVSVTSENYMGITGDNIDGMVSYDDQSATLTLEGATISSGGITYQASGNLTLIVTGNCTIRGNILSTGSSTLTMKLNDLEDPGSLTYRPSNGDASGFTRIVYDGMYLMPGVYKDGYLESGNSRDVKYSPTRQRYEENPYSSLSTIYFSSDKNYELWLGSIKVTEANKNNILGGETVTATFNPNDSTLTLNDMTLVGKSIHDAGIISRLEKLTIFINGNNTITSKDSCTAIRADMEGKQTLIIEKGSDDCSLALNTSHAIHDFNTLTLNGLFWNDRFTYGFDETLAGYDSGYRLMKADGVEAQKDDDTGFIPTLSDTEEYGIIISTDAIGDISITNKNRLNVLNNAVTAATVQFDGLHTLILNNASLLDIEVDSDPSFATTGLTIFLKGTNTIINSSNDIAIFKNGTPNIDLTFTTDRDTPGQLTCSYSDAANLFPNLDAVYQNGLAPNVNTVSMNVTISQSMPPIVNKIDQDEVLDGDGEGLGKDIEFDGYTDAQATAKLTAGVIVNKILYRLPDADDGYFLEDGNKLVCLNSYMTDTEMEGIATQVENGTLFPGTEGFAEVFKGMCFLVPEGSGNIIVECNTGSSGELHVYKGKNDIKEISVTEGYETITIPYAFTKGTYVYLYSAVEKNASSRFDGSHRAPGRKMTTTTSVRRAGVKSSSVGSTPPPPLSPKKLTKADVVAALATVDDIVKGLTIDDTEIVDIEDDAFDDLDGTQVTYVDLSKTSIIDQTVDRREVPFNVVPAGAFIYLPTGNDISTASDAKFNNVVIGTVCPDMLLPEGGYPFKAAMDFTAKKAVQERVYTPGEKGTIFLPFAINKEMVSELGTFYQIVSISDSRVKMGAVEETEANVPYMFDPAKETLSVEMVDVKTDVPDLSPIDEFSFIGTYEKQELTPDNMKATFCFINGQFVYITGSTTKVTVNPFRAYMNGPYPSSSSHILDIDWGDDTTMIQIINCEPLTNNQWFDLQGHRILYPTKGIYILNGKKVMIK